MALIDTLYEEAVRRRDSKKDSSIPRILIGMATCGIAAGAMETRRAFKEALGENGIDAVIATVGCMGHCYGEPLVLIENPGFPPILYHDVTPGKARMLVKNFLGMGDPLYEYLLGAVAENDMIPHVKDFPRFQKELRVVTSLSGIIDPEDIYEYIAEGGYGAFAKALEMNTSELIGAVSGSGLRGRGGAGFPTGRKWEIAAKAGRAEKVVICNADEGDPGAYMDRTILESNPHLVLEGMAICARAVGASRAVVYVRAEYPLAVSTVTKAIGQAEELGILGGSVLGTDMSLKVTVFQGSGAFVCGEETALIQSMEGNRGMPRLRPPFPVEKGLSDLPTVINNVKTLASIPAIIKEGPDSFRSVGTDKSPGTAIFSVVGNVVHPGLVEIPMGVTLGTLINEVCGGIPRKKRFKAVQIGGPSGGCLPEKFLETPIDFDSLTSAGAMMGSGGMVVMDEDACMVNVARYFLDFTQKESCGKCTFCRVGTLHLKNVLDRITKGEGKEEDLLVLEELSRDIKAGSLCGLGKTAPNPVITSLSYFRDEYEAHVREKRCPACMCRPLTAFYIDLDKCARGCDACVGSCPVEAIFTTKDRKKAVDQTLCVKCGECMTACPSEYSAVRKISPADKAPRIERPAAA